MKKLFSFAFVILLVFVSSRALVRALPGDPVENILAETGTRLSAQALRSDLGLDRPLLASAFADLKGFFHGDFGRSILSGEPVAPSLRMRLAITAKLATLTLLFGLCLSVTLGLLAAAAAESPRLRWADRLCTRFGAW